MRRIGVGKRNLLTVRQYETEVLCLGACCEVEGRSCCYEVEVESEY